MQFKKKKRHLERKKYISANEYSFLPGFSLNNHVFYEH